MNAVVPFPERAGRDLKTNPSAGYAAITRKVERIIEDHEPEPQAARLVVRAAVLACVRRVRPGETAEALRSLADEVEGMR